MADERKRILRALRGRQAPVHDPMGGLADRLGEEVLPAVDLETAARRLLSALEGNPERLRKVLRDTAEGVGLFLVKGDPKEPKGSAKVDSVLREVDRTAGALRDWADRLERQSRAVVIRSTDPGTTAPESRCPDCGLPNLLAATVQTLAGKGEGWCLVVVPDEE